MASAASSSVAGSLRIRSFGSGPDRRSALYKLFADARDIISKLPKKPDPIFSADKDFTISDESMALINKTLRKGHDIQKKYSKNPGYYP